ncbi:hypothetical protein RTG05_06075 [Geodermatophilus sp. DSM 44513]|nr:hypothetical protein [Geodermatophilus sp. DSM 44513]WNV76842.1 hypothetical protein RTG05_06075 [Geodermatophilus sp. DSM 44513]
MLEQAQAGVVGSLQTLQVEEDPPVATLAERQDGAGQQIGRLDGQVAASPHDPGATVDDLGGGKPFVPHGQHLRARHSGHLTGPPTPTTAACLAGLAMAVPGV